MMPAGLLMALNRGLSANSTLSVPHLQSDSGWQMTVVCVLPPDGRREGPGGAAYVVCCRHDEAQSHFCRRSAYGRAQLEAGRSSDTVGLQDVASVGASASQPHWLPGGVGWVLVEAVCVCVCVCVCVWL
jgi:hypothetical protein